MRVLCIGNMYPPHHLGGYEVIWHAAVEHLRDAGHTVEVLTSDYRAPDPDPDFDEAPAVHRDLRWYWDEHDFPPIGMRERIALERANAAVLGGRLDSLRPDVVAWWAMGGMSMSMIETVRRRGLPAAGFVIDEWLIYGPLVDPWIRLAGRRPAFAGMLERLSGVPAHLDLDGSARWAFVSEALRGHADDAGIELTRTEILNAGIDPDLFAAADPLPWNGRLLYVGRLDQRKGVHTAIGALTSLPDMNLTVIGGGDERYRLHLKELSERLGVAERVRFERVGRRELGAAYADADAVVFPVTWAEPWGLVPLEAMSVGRPVIATGTGGSGEYLRDGENALLFAPHDDPDALASAVQRLAGEPELRERLIAGGRRTAAANHAARFNRGVERILHQEAGA